MDKPDIYNQINIYQVNETVKFFEQYGKIIRDHFGDKKVSLIDIGSACGRVLNEAIIPKSGLNFSKVVGSDISPEMVEFANKKYGNDMLSFHFFDFQSQIPETLKNQKFDVMTSTFSLHFSTELYKAVKNIDSLLNPNGLFCCVYLKWCEVIDAYHILSQKYPGYFKNWKDKYTPLWHQENPQETFKEEFEKAGIKIIEFSEVAGEYDFGSMENHQKYYESVEIFSKSMPQDVKRNYLKDHEEAFLSIRKTNGFVIIPKLWFVIGKKQ